MLYNHQGKQVHIPANKELGDATKRQLREVLEPASHKGHPFFRIEARARVTN